MSYHIIKGVYQSILAGACLLTLGACDKDGNFILPPPSQASTDTAAAADTDPAAAQAPNTELIERDVEAPEVFNVSDKGLWDGRPSLGGVWVAHPDVKDPERVIVRNLSNGNFVIGALFRRERDFPGPAVQVSSDAALALDMLAGAPTDLEVVALRKEVTLVAPPEPVAVADFDADAIPDETAENPAEIAEAADAIASAAIIPDVGPGVTVIGAPVPTSAGGTSIAERARAAITAAETRPAPSGNGARQFIQVGIFSVQANALSASKSLGQSGILATVLDQNSNGRRFWRVVVGPVENAADRNRVLEQVKRQGFGDAYFVRN